MVLNSSIHPILTPDTTVFGIMYHFMEQTELSKLNAAMCKLLQFHFDDLNQNSCGYWKIIISILDITSAFFTLRLHPRIRCMKIPGCYWTFMHCNNRIMVNKWCSDEKKHERYIIPRISHSYHIQDTKQSSNSVPVFK